MNTLPESTVHGRRLVAHLVTGPSASLGDADPFSGTSQPYRVDGGTGLQIPLPGRIPRQSGSGPWHHIVRHTHYTPEWLDAFREINSYDTLLVKINQRNSSGQLPVMVAANVHNSLLLEFMVETFGTDLLVRTDTSNLLNACCFNGIPDAVCIKVAKAYPELLCSTPGGVLRRSSACEVLALRERRIHPWFMQNRNPLHDLQLAKSIVERINGTVIPLLNLWDLLFLIQTTIGYFEAAQASRAAMSRLWAKVNPVTLNTPAKEQSLKRLFTVANIFCVGMSPQTRPAHSASPTQRQFGKFAAASIILQVSSVLVRGNADIDRKVWTQVKKDFYLMPSISRISPHVIDSAKRRLNKVSRDYQLFATKRDSIFAQFAEWKTSKIVCLPIRRRIDIEGNRRAVLFAMMSSMRRLTSKVDLPYMPAEIWNIVLNIMCTTRRRASCPPHTGARI